MCYFVHTIVNRSKTSVTEFLGRVEVVGGFSKFLVLVDGNFKVDMALRHRGILSRVVLREDFQGFVHPSVADHADGEDNYNNRQGSNPST